MSVSELALAYLTHADGDCRKDGRPTTEPAGIRLAIRPLRRLYGHTAAAAFGPLTLKAVRAEMVAAGLGRREVNKRVGSGPPDAIGRGDLLADPIRMRVCMDLNLISTLQ